jgi:DNA repair photolyase
VIIAEGVFSDVRARARLVAMMGRISCDDVACLPDERVADELLRFGRRERLRPVGLEREAGVKDLVAFSVGAERDIFPGYTWREQRSAKVQSEQHGVLCQSAVEIQSAVGCPFTCSYCPYASFVSVRLDVERFVDQVAGLVQQHPRQLLYKLNNRTDTLGFEPEYGLSEALVRQFATLSGKYLLLYSKGDQVEHLLSLEHRGKTIASCTLTPDPVAALIESGAPSPSRRIAALGALSRAGYPVRVRLSPIVPVLNWRDMYRSLLDRLAAVARPEMITLWTLSMVELEALPRLFPVERLDPDAHNQARSCRTAMRGKKGAPFPPALRAEIYETLFDEIRKRLPACRVALCLETPTAWKALGHRSSTSEGFVCNCGPVSTPARIRRALPLRNLAPDAAYGKDANPRTT